jgi:hypothetical protein
MKIAMRLACENWFGDEESELDRFRLLPKLVKISLVVPGTLRSVGVLVRSDRGLHDRRAGQREVINVVCGPDAAEEILSCNFCETDLRVVLRGVFYVDGVHNNTCVSVVAA